MSLILCFLLFVMLFPSLRESKKITTGKTYFILRIYHVIMKNNASSEHIQAALYFLDRKQK